MSNASYDVGIVGLGYVGLTLATVLAEVGQRVLGVETRRDVVAATNAGTPHFSEAGLRDALERVTGSGRLVASETFAPGAACATYIITVGTPLGADGVARFDMIEAATRQVAESMEDGALVILRSTVKVGTARNVVAPILAATGKRFEIAMCPERTLEGRALQELRELPQIIGADSEEARTRAERLFRLLTNSIVQVSSCETAEMIKLVDNTYRDVRFAFANEVARTCEAFGVNAHEVIASGKLGYPRTDVPLPGPVGGPCLEKDPHILVQSARSRGLDLEITRASRLVNERQPAETVDFIAAEMARRSFGAGAEVAVLGIAFKGVPATDDLRGSMSLRIIAALRRSRPDMRLRIFDPVARPPALEAAVTGATVCESLEDAVGGAQVVLIANNHPDLRRIPLAGLLAMMAPGGFVYDYWNHFSNLSPHEMGEAYYAVGNTRGAAA
jgi:UDP-N-acetyl-D-mannosaminuronic acid dehydrogenase